MNIHGCDSFRCFVGGLNFHVPTWHRVLTCDDSGRHGLQEQTDEDEGIDEDCQFDDGESGEQEFGAGGEFHEWFSFFQSVGV